MEKSRSVTLEDFIPQALGSITKGVKKAQETLENGNMINPVSLAWRHTAEKSGKAHFDGAPIADIEFDLAISVTESEGDSGNFNISVMGIGFGFGTEDQKAHLSTHRVKFKIPIVLPPGYTEEAPYDEGHHEIM